MLRMKRGGPGVGLHGQRASQLSNQTAVSKVKNEVQKMKVMSAYMFVNY
jgi:hypothetical protein